MSGRGAEVWWISDGPVDQGGRKILGPFESRDLALNVRRLYEDHPDAEGLTYWVSRDSDAERRLAVKAPTPPADPGADQ